MSGQYLFKYIGIISYLFSYVNTFLSIFWYYFNMFADILKDLLFEKGISQKDLSVKADIPQTTISGWLRAGRLPDYNALIKLSTFFGVSSDFLLGKEDDLGIKGYEPVKERISATEPLSREEADLLKDFRKLGIFARSSILIQVRALAEKAEKEDIKQK